MTRSDMMGHRRPAVVLVIALLAGLAGGGGIVSAQVRPNELNALYQRIDRLERELSDVQGQLYRGGVPRAPVSTGVDRKITAGLSVRITELEGQISQLTGRIEELQFLLNRTKTRVDKLVEDVDFRLSAIERNMAAAAAAETAPRPPRAAPVTGSVAVDRSRSTNARAPKSLGTISPDDLKRVGTADPAAVRQAPVATTVLPQGSVEERYDFAYSLLRGLDYSAAGQAFAEFLTAHPDHPLASNAQYWLGESYYVQKDYDRAAKAFLDGYNRFNDGQKAPDSLLKLGASLNAMDKKAEACLALRELATRFPNAKPPIKRRAADVRRRAGCS